ncbi:MAG: alpha/beta fold hydrolase [Immundisolibacteraceae bacterium]|nr:alpha/beta fold hydrolase [Immundisolibacteraceae bacterium]
MPSESSHLNDQSDSQSVDGTNAQPSACAGYQASGLYRSGHFQTVFPTLLRRVTGVSWQRERITTADQDFIDLDWLSGGHSRLVLLCHGLEGDSDTHYMKGMARAVSAAGWDVVGYHFRGCSGEPNLLARAYHSGATDDLAKVIDHVLSGGQYQQLALVGFSLGGNLVLKYLGEPNNNRPPQLCGGVAISPPCDLSGCCDRLDEAQNWIYQQRFLLSLQGKMNAKGEIVRRALGVDQLPKCRSVREFDHRFTAPLHGFDGATDYYQQSSSKQFLGEITHPALLISAWDDPFLSPSCFPEKGQVSDQLQLKYSQHGGHVSFMQRDSSGDYWAEQRCVEFLAAF